MSLRLLSLQLSIAAVMLASVGQVFADPSDLMEGAQSIPSRQGHKIVIPASSLAGPQARGIRANTNVRFVVPDRSPARRLSAGGPPFLGYNFETPASLACIYIFGQQATGCNPNSVTAVAQGGSR